MRYLSLFCLLIISGYCLGQDSKSFSDRCLWTIRFGPVSSADQPSITDAIIALGLTHDPQYIDALADIMLNHPNDNVRHKAAKALFWMNDQSTVPYFRQALDDEYRFTVGMAQRALEQLTGEIFVEKKSKAELKQRKKMLEIQLRTVNAQLQTLQLQGK